MTDQIEKPEEALLKEFYSVFTPIEVKKLEALVPYIEDNRVQKTMLELREIWGKSESTIRKTSALIQAKKIAGEQTLRFMRIAHSDEYIIEFSKPVLKVLFYLSS